MESIEDAARQGGVIAILLFLIIYVVMMMAADRISEAVDIFARTLLTVLFVFVPTSPVGAVVSLFAGVIGAAISLDNIGPSVVRAIIIGGFCYTLTNLVINWFTVPVP